MFIKHHRTFPLNIRKQKNKTTVEICLSNPQVCLYPGGPGHHQSTGIVEPRRPCSFNVFVLEIWHGSGNELVPTGVYLQRISLQKDPSAF